MSFFAVICSSMLLRNLGYGVGDESTSILALGIADMVAVRHARASDPLSQAVAHERVFDAQLMLASTTFGITLLVCAIVTVLIFYSEQRILNSACALPARWLPRLLEPMHRVRDREAREHFYVLGFRNLWKPS